MITRTKSTFEPVPRTSDDDRRSRADGLLDDRDSPRWVPCPTCEDDRDVPARFAAGKNVPR
jgi:hypothetical protein